MRHAWQSAAPRCAHARLAAERAPPARRCSAGRRRSVRCTAGDDSLFGKLSAGVDAAKRFIEFELNYENWAPRGARAYRLRELPRDVQTRDSDKDVGEGGGGNENDPVLSAALRSRLAEVERAEPGSALSGSELAEICLLKYGVAYDMAIVQKDFPGVTRIVALNLYCNFVGQKSFPFSAEQYISKLDAVAYVINASNTAEYVRAFFRSPIAPRAGLPSRPRVDTAVTLRLNGAPEWDAELAEAIFAEK